MLPILCIILIVHLAYSIQYDEPACKILKDDTKGVCYPKRKNSQRIVVVGDVHGAYDGLLEVLYHANITADKSSCVWKKQPVKTLLVQVGDLVDRGPGALESFACLRKLQTEAPKFNGAVVRLLGNHDMWWLEGIFNYRHKQADTKANIETFIKLTMEDIANNKVLGAYVHTLNRIPLLFVHAGFSPAFLTYLKRNKLSDANPYQLANYTNNELKKTLAVCRAYPCKLDGELFEAGPDRGGKGIGGPFWTDFGVLEEAAKKQNKPNPFIQVVGHTMAFCYSPRYPNVHPPDSHAECALGLIRATNDLSGFCVDGGMYVGARAFMEIGVDGHFRSFERRGNADVPFKVRDFTTEKCDITCDALL